MDGLCNDGISGSVEDKVLMYRVDHSMVILCHCTLVIQTSISKSLDKFNNYCDNSFDTYGCYL